MTALIGVLARLSNQVAMVVVTLVATRFLDPTAFGVFGLAAAGVTLVRTLLYSGPFEFLLKSPDADADSSSCLVVNLVLAAILGLVLVGLGGVGEPLFGARNLLPILAAMAPSNLIAAFTAWQEAHLLRSGRITAYYGATILCEAVAAVVAIILLVSGWGLWALVAQAYARTISVAVAYFFLKRSAPVLNATLEKMMEILSWSRARYGSVLAGFASNYGADFVLGALLSPAATGLYRASSRIVTAVSDLFSHPARTIGVTAFSARAANGLGASDLWPRILLGVTVFGWSALAGLAVLAGDYAPLILGHQWAAAGPIISILCLNGAGNVVSAITGPYLVAYNRQATVLRIQLAVTVLSLLALVIAAPHGVLAAASASTAVLALSHLMLLGAAIRHEAGTDRSAATVLGMSVIAVLATAAGAGLGLFVFPPSQIIRLPVSIALGVAGWTGVVVVIRRKLLDSLHALGPRQAV